MSDERDESTDLESDEPYVPKTSGWPMWDFEADKILSGIRHWVQKGGDESHVAYADFLHILDAFLRQLIDWAEQTDPPIRTLRKWAGYALADRLQFLSAQQDHWCGKNEGFRKRRAEFGDRRHARSPRSYISWLAGDYLRKLMNQRMLAEVLLSQLEMAKKSANGADVAGFKERISYLKELAALPDFSPESAPRWAEFVFERMQQDEQYILNLPKMRECNSRDSRERRRSGAVRLYDFKNTIVGAVVSLATKPAGHIRGITRPAY